MILPLTLTSVMTDIQLLSVNQTSVTISDSVFENAILEEAYNDEKEPVQGEI